MSFVTPSSRSGGIHSEKKEAAGWARWHVLTPPSAPTVYLAHRSQRVGPCFSKLGSRKCPLGRTITLSRLNERHPLLLGDTPVSVTLCVRGMPAIGDIVNGLTGGMKNGTVEKNNNKKACRYIEERERYKRKREDGSP